MSRPQSVADLNTHQETARIATFKVDDLVKLHNGEILSAYLKFIEAAERYGATLEEDYSGTNVKMPRSSKELAKKLETAQEEWDANLKRYVAALKNPTDPTQGHYEYPSLRRALNEWAEREGFEKIDWPQDRSAETESYDTYNSLDH